MTLCPRCQRENLVKTIFGSFKCPGCLRQKQKMGSVFTRCTQTARRPAQDYRKTAQEIGGDAEGLNPSTE
ncbi:hypothetical protein ABH15_09175 [Methanoculleus taiwanensis]|uniref:Uncharacterized protein n=1 Tax=Methanoculleus taiwanensis TaxID=1550565 RepID=A0A498H112_9EURY|nr:hypothetical protein ABH15_09175 [Methanoculleus taiwanensis]